MVNKFRHKALPCVEHINILAGRWGQDGLRVEWNGSDK